ncbi:TatD family hydrolase [Hahella sp. SMD15-11]|uniref:TatD family hydrolase n=1 Tax=Thermohahella caldifontis TaxID=3142973 RepID=A0AB39UX80_9GAMM
MTVSTIASLTDSHCHLDRLDLEPFGGDLSAALNAARERGVTRFVCISIDHGNMDQVVDLAEQHPDVWATAGIHPLTEPESPFDAGEIERVAKRSSRVVAIGECGLDYYYHPESRPVQLERFEAQLDLAARLGKPVVVHTRQAVEDTLALIRQYSQQGVTGVLHCFTESWEMARAALDLGWYISFSGIITFRNASELRDTVARVPLEQMLVETDSPYLAPVPHRGKSNSPMWVREVARQVADIKGVDLSVVARETSCNASTLFGLEAHAG